MCGLDCSIIMHPQVWKVSGHHDLFHDYMVDCRESKKRYRQDHVRCRWVGYRDQRVCVSCLPDSPEKEQDDLLQKALKFFNVRSKNARTSSGKANRSRSASSPAIIRKSLAPMQKPSAR